MESVTLGQIGLALAFIAALIASIGAISKVVSKAVKKAFEAGTKAITDRLDKLDKKVDGVDMENCKNYLVTFLAEVSRGEPKDETEYQRFWEQYQHYKSIGGNTYIQHKVEALEKEGKL